MPTTDTKTALLNSAEHAARTLGFDGFSYADLAEDVGIRKASIHHHFPSKANLSVALMQRYLATFQETCSKIEADCPTGGARLTELIERYRVGSDDGKRLCLCVSFSASRDSLPPDVLDQISRFRSMIIEWMTETFKLGQSDGSITGTTAPALEAAAALSLFEGAQLAARAEENPALFDNAIELLRQRIRA
ncbi:MAG: TetR/AcrR family transcriptional regulator [Sulfitobacter sp.]